MAFARHTTRGSRRQPLSSSLNPVELVEEGTRRTRRRTSALNSEHFEIPRQFRDVLPATQPQDGEAQIEENAGSCSSRTDKFLFERIFQS